MMNLIITDMTTNEIVDNKKNFKKYIIEIMNSNISDEEKNSLIKSINDFHDKNIYDLQLQRKLSEAGIKHKLRVTSDNPNFVPYTTY